MQPAAELTEQQKLVLQALAREGGPVTAYVLLDKLRGKGLRAPTQIYRVLEKLMLRGLVHKLESLNAFVACAHPHAPHKHGLVAFAICDRCGMATEFTDKAIERRLLGWAGDHAFQPGVSLLEMHGVCAHCTAP